MKMKKLILAFAIVALMVCSCNKAPEACVEIDKTTASAGEPISFSSCSKRSLSFIWSFEGPISAPENSIGSSDEVVNIAFSVPGTYTVTLEVFKKYSFQGESATASTNFTIQ